MEYRGLRVGVLCSTYTWGEIWLKDFLAKINNECIEKVRKSVETPFIITLKDGTIIEAIIFRKSTARGKKFDKIFVDPDLTEEDFLKARYLLSQSIIIEHS